MLVKYGFLSDIGYFGCQLISAVQILYNFACKGQIQMGEMKPLVNIPGCLLFLFNYNMALLGAIFPIYFCPLQAKF